MLSTKILQTKTYKILIYLLMVSIVLSLIPIQKVKASQLDANQRIHYLYNSFYYDFIPDDSIPTGYEFNSDVIEYVISKGADAINAYQTQRYGTIINSYVNRVSNVLYSLMRNAAITLGKVNVALLDSDASIYTWHYECTGIDTDYEFSAEYGTAYGFKFVGICDEVFTLVLDQNGGFYGSQKIGNWTYSTGTAEVINQIAPQYDPNEIWIPDITQINFNDLKPPFISGKSLYFYIYESGVEHEYYVPDFTRCIVFFYLNAYNTFQFYISNVDNEFVPEVYKDGSLIGSVQNYAYKYTGLHKTNPSFSYLNSQRWFTLNINTVSFNFPSLIDDFNTYGVSSPNSLGFYNGQRVSGYGDVWLDAVSTTPTGTPANPQPAPIETPIPVTEIPSNPEDPIPQNPIPDPVPGVPVNPVPIPLPPFASIVSGNDELWGETLGFEEAQDGLLPYINSLSEFTFPSFTDLISDFSGSIIWVAQIMSILYNGTSFNVLFIALCLFSLVSILIGAYKLWATTEPDPNNPGFRRTKRPPKPPKGRRRR